MENKAIISLLDLTLLDENASVEAIKNLADKAAHFNVAAICVYPKHLQYISPKISIPRATVVNFPSGDAALNDALNQITHAIHQQKANEIDYVFPYKTYLKDNKAAALEHYEACYRLCQERQIPFKAILETGAFPTLQTIYEASTAILKIGCEFLKTSTGKIPQGASIPAAIALLSALKDTQSQCGIKLSGGVRTPEQAKIYIELAELMLGKKVDKSWFRLGASSLLDELV